MWLSLLSRFWLPLTVAAAFSGVGLYYGHSRYESGYAASEASWQQRFAAAERARDAANRVALQKESDSIRLSQTAGAEHAKTLASLYLRAADAERRYASILRKPPAGSGSCAVRQDGGPAADADAARASSELIDRIGRDFGALARRCEGDAAALTDLQEWVRGQRAILNRPN